MVEIAILIFALGNDASNFNSKRVYWWLKTIFKPP